MSEFYKNVYGNQRVRRTPDPVGDQLRVYQYPMQTDTNNPKIPDGKALLSVGVKLQRTAELVQTTEVMELFMFPGFNNGMCYMGGRNTDGDVIENNLFYPTHGRVEAVPPPPLPQNAPAGTPQNPPGKGATLWNEQQWRLVSQQLKLTSLNSAHDYDGWWECVRFTCVPSDIQVWSGPQYAPTGNANPVVMVFVGKYPDNAVRPNAFPALNTVLTTNPTYCTGKIKDLHRFNFQLLPNMNNHDFVDLDELGEDADYNDQLIDKTFDCWYMRLHGTPLNQANALLRPTTIMAHLVSNQELIYRENAERTRYHTECYDATTKLRQARRQLRLNNKAAKPMYGGGV